MLTLTKLILNNEIVKFRKPVRQSRVHSISKLSREIKKLKEKKGTDEQKAKNLKKAERYVQELLAMKKFTDDEISKFALLNERTLTEITNDVNESLEKKALARLVHHKAVADKVRNFREQFPEWKESLELLLETLGEKYKYKKPKKMKTQRNSKPKISNNSGEWTVETIPEKRGKKVVDETVVQKKSIAKDPVEIEPKSQKNEVKPTSKPECYSKCDDRVTKDESVVESNDVLHPENDADMTEVNEVAGGAVDPFFLTKDNVEYISVSAKENVSNKEREYRVDEPWKKASVRDRPRVHDFNHHNSRQRHSRFSEPKQRKFIRNEDHNPRRSQNFHQHRERIPPSSQPTLHPSWEAKKKLTQVVRFEGKKIKFDPS